MVLLLWTISGCGEKSIEEVLELMEESLEHNQSMTDNRNTVFQFPLMVKNLRNLSKVVIWKNLSG